MFNCFEGGLDLDKLDREPFTFKHKLMQHPALSLENLERVIPALPEAHIKYSSGKLRNGDAFEAAYKTHRNGMSIDETIHTIRTSDSYIMVREPEVHASFHELHHELTADVAVLMKQAGWGGNVLDPRLYMFIASPGAFTPFHIDRNSTLLMQFRGRKEIAVFPAWDDDVVSASDREDYVGYANKPLPWHEEMDPRAARFDFGPGDALHIPFLSGHYVRNSLDDVSISLSIIFNSARTAHQIRALSLNRRVRPLLGRLGLTPRPVGQAYWRDTVKSTLFRVGGRVGRMLRGHN